MAKTVDWYYHRSGCKTCGRMDALLTTLGITAKETVSAHKAKLGLDDALALARSVRRIVAARGKSAVELDMSRDAPDDATLARYLLGPTGNLRSPTIRTGKTLLVGFDEDAMAPLLR